VSDLLKICPNFGKNLIKGIKKDIITLSVVQHQESTDMSTTKTCAMKHQCSKAAKKLKGKTADMGDDMDTERESVNEEEDFAMGDIDNADEDFAMGESD
jgi:hypothetical protein